MNEAKTEFTHVHLSHTQEVNENGLALHGKEKWRKSKKLGSVLCSSSDITARCIKGNIAFQSYWKLWIRGSKIPLKTKIYLYDTTCVSQMLYNCNSWQLQRNFWISLMPATVDTFAPSLAIAGHRWPDNVISNDTLYNMCNVAPLSVRVNQQRWSMFGHVLRMPVSTLAQQALEFAVLGSSKYDPVQAATAQTCSAYCGLTSEKQALVHSDRKRNCGSLGCLPKIRDSGAWQRRTDCSCGMIFHFTVTDTVIDDDDEGTYTVCL